MMQRRKANERGDGVQSVAWLERCARCVGRIGSVGAGEREVDDTLDALRRIVVAV